MPWTTLKQVPVEEAVEVAQARFLPIQPQAGIRRLVHPTLHVGHVRQVLFDHRSPFVCPPIGVPLLGHGRYFLSIAEAVEEDQVVQA